MKALYKPFGVIVGIVAGLAAKSAFSRIWDKLDGDEDGPPKPEEADATFAAVLGAAVLQGAVVALVRTAVKRSGAHAWWNLTGTWPGPRRSDEQQA